MTIRFTNPIVSGPSISESRVTRAACESDRVDVWVFHVVLVDANGGNRPVQLSVSRGPIELVDKDNPDGQIVSRDTVVALAANGAVADAVIPGAFAAFEAALLAAAGTTILDRAKAALIQLGWMGGDAGNVTLEPSPTDEERAEPVREKRRQEIEEEGAR